jgi:hypothetical protein
VTVLANDTVDLSLWCQSRRGRRGGIVPPSSVLAPETALGSRPRVALSSAQVSAILRPSRLGHNLVAAGSLTLALPGGPGLVQLAVARRKDLLLAAEQLVLGSDIANGTV